MKRYLLGFLMAAALCVALPVRAHAEREHDGTYWTDGCMETVTEQVTNDLGTGPRWRILYKCCGASCWAQTDWMTGTGPVQICGTPCVLPNSSSLHPLATDGNGNTIISVAPGKGGTIGNSSTGCLPFTANGGDVIVIAAGI